MRSRLYESVEALLADLDAWLRHHNHERPHLSYRNQRRRPWDTVERFVSQSSVRRTLRRHVTRKMATHHDGAYPRGRSALT
jgi:hypothetical protein